MSDGPERIDVAAELAKIEAADRKARAANLAARRADPIPVKPPRGAKERKPNGWDVWADAMAAGGKHGLSPAETLVYCRMRWRGRWFYEAPETTGNILGLSPKTVRRAKAGLCAKGLVRKVGTGEAGTTGGKQAVNRYEVLEG